LYKREGNCISNEILIYVLICGGGKEIRVLAYKSVFDAVGQAVLVSFPIHPWHRWQSSYHRPSGRDHYGKPLVIPAWNQTSIIQSLNTLRLLNYTVKYKE